MELGILEEGCIPHMLSLLTASACDCSQWSCPVRFIRLGPRHTTTCTLHLEHSTYDSFLLREEPQRTSPSRRPGLILHFSGFPFLWISHVPSSAQQLYCCFPTLYGREHPILGLVCFPRDSPAFSDGSNITRSTPFPLLLALEGRNFPCNVPGSVNFFTS